MQADEQKEKISRSKSYLIIESRELRVAQEELKDLVQAKVDGKISRSQYCDKA